MVAHNKLFLSLLLLGFLIVFLGLNFRIIQREKEARKEMDFLQQVKQQLELEKKEFLSVISGAKKDAYLEKVARERLNLQKQGETAVAFPISEQVKENTSSAPVQKQSFWQKILEIIKIRKRQ